MHNKQIKKDKMEQFIETIKKIAEEEPNCHCRRSYEIKKLYYMVHFILIGCNTKNFIQYEDVDEEYYNNLAFDELFDVLKSFGLFELLENGKLRRSELIYFVKLMDLNNYLESFGNKHFKVLYDNAFRLKIN